jgi:uncharacterized linocin/CFP29 family protein
MSDDGHQLPWSDEQWAELQQLVQTSSRRARVASSFLPLHGPLPRGQSTVPALAMAEEALNDRQRGEPDSRLDIDDGAVLHLTTIACDVYVKTTQAEDPSLAAVRDLVARAADVLGRLEDAIVFHGQPAASMAPGAAAATPQQSEFVRPYIYSVRHGQNNPGLLTPHPDPNFAVRLTKRLGTVTGPELVARVVEAIQELEKMGHYGPFACVLGSKLFEAAITPDRGSMVLPSDRITPFLDGPLLRSSTMLDDRGVVVALAGAPIDLVVGSDIHLSFLQRSLEPRYVLRVSERFVLRLKQPEAVCQLDGPKAPGTAAEEASTDKEKTVDEDEESPEAGGTET